MKKYLSILRKPDLQNKIILFCTMLSLFFLFNCRDIKRNSRFIPLAYEYPVTRIGKGKIVSYKKIGIERQDYTTHLNLVTEDQKQFLIVSNYTYGYIVDSLKKTLDGKLVEKYNFDLYHNMHFRFLTGKVVTDEILDNGSRYGKRITKIKYSFFNKEINVTEEEEHLYDTIVEENGTQFKCFVTQTKSTIYYLSNKKKIAKEIVKKKSYFGKGRGLFCYKIDSKNESEMWIQMSIEDMK